MNSLEAASLVNRYRFVLNAFGVQAFNTALIKKGKDLKQPEDSSYTSTNTNKGEPNMHSGFSKGVNNSPVRTGKQAISDLGTPIFSDLILYKNDQKEEQGLQITRIIIEVEMTKNIVKTAIQGRNGTVKEYISNGDFIVSLKGAIVRSFKSNFPKEEIKMLLDLLQQNKSLKVTNEYLLMYGIYELCVDGYKMGQEKGRQNVQTFEINCSSDTPLLLKKKNVRS